MKKVLLSLFMAIMISQPANAFCLGNCYDNPEEKAVRNLIKSQVRFANRTNLKKLLSTYDKDYVNSDGFNLEIYSKLIQDIWDTYKDIEYDIVIKNVTINNNKAEVEVIEKSHADIAAAKLIPGKLNSEANSIYYLHKTDKGWKVISDKVIDETTSMLYGDAMNLDIKLSVPEIIPADTEYSAVLEFVPPENTIAIASLASDKVEYPQKQTKEVFRALPEDNILERLFTSNKENLNEYIVASIGLTKTSVDDLSVKLSLSGFGYLVKRVNVEGADVKNK